MVEVNRCDPTGGKGIVYKKILNTISPFYFLKRYKIGYRSFLSTLAHTSTVQSFVNFFVHDKNLWSVCISHFYFYSSQSMWVVASKAQLEVQQPPSLLAEVLLLNFTQDKYFTWQAFTSLCSIICHSCNQRLRRRTVTSVLVLLSSRHHLHPLSILTPLWFKIFPGQTDDLQTFKKENGF